MSKRYGRNQKRRARERIAQLEQARTMDAGLLRNQSQRLRDAEDALSRVEELLGKHTAALPPKRIKLDTDSLDGRFDFKSMNHERDPLSWAHASGRISQLTCTVNRMASVIAKVKQQDRPDFGVHVVVDFANKHYAYAASSQAIANTRKVDLIQYISESIARQLAESLS